MSYIRAKGFQNIHVIPRDQMKVEKRHFFISVTFVNDTLGYDWACLADVQ